MNHEKFISPLILGILLIGLLTCQKGWDKMTTKDTFVSYIEAVNRHNEQEILSFLADDFVLEFAGYDMKIPKSQLGDILGWDRGANGRVRYENLQIKNNVMEGDFYEDNDFLKLLGIDHLQSRVTYEFNAQGKIIKQVYQQTPNQPSWEPRLQPAIEWAKEHRPEALAGVYPDQKMAFNEKTAKGWIALLKEWKAR